MIWSFKDGKSYLNVAWMIANKLHQVFGDDVKNIVFAFAMALLELSAVLLLRLCVSFQVLSMRMNIYVSVEIVWLFMRNLIASRFKKYK